MWAIMTNAERAKARGSRLSSLVRGQALLSLLGTIITVKWYLIVLALFYALKCAAVSAEARALQ